MPPDATPNPTPEPQPTGAGESLAPGVELPSAALRFTFSRSSGPGGQNVNKLNTRATLHVSLEALEQAMPAYAFRRIQRLAGSRLSGDSIVIHADDSRSQHANRTSCLVRLRELVVLAMHRPRPRKPTRPTRGSVERRLQAKKEKGQAKARRRSLE